MRITTLAVVALLIAAPFTGAAQSAKEILNNKNIIDLHKAGIEDDIIIAKIESSECKFDLSTNGMIDLKTKGVPSSLIRAMMNKSDGKTQTVTTSTINSPSSSIPVNSKITTGKSGFRSISLIGQVYYWNSSAQSGIVLEKIQGNIKRGVGIFKAHDSWRLEKPKSDVRLRVSDANEFIINTGSPTIPNLVLFKASSSKDHREATKIVATFSGTKESPDLLPINITKLAEGIYEIVPDAPLKKGEYFFSVKPDAKDLSLDAYAFGVD